MYARNPEVLHRMFAKSFSAGNIDALMAIYEPGACLNADALLTAVRTPGASQAPDPNRVVTGTEVIRQVVSGFFAVKPEMRAKTRKVMRVGDIVLLHSEWTVTATGPDGNAVKLVGQSAEVVRRQPDGTWLCIIDNPLEVTPSSR